VDREVVLTGDSGDLGQLESAALELAPRLDRGQPFSVQTRLAASLSPETSSLAPPYGRFDVNERLAAALRDATGAPLDVRAPEQVLSVFVTPDVGYLGLSKAEENLSAWAGGGIRFAREPDQVSRSEFKLLEALSVFHLSLPTAGGALDLGASPGGWTRLLRRAGLTVTAVDPGDLDPRVTADPGVRHVRATAQEFRCRPGEFAVIVNDMRMDARDSVRLMLEFAPCLAVEGWAVMTVKLPHRSAEQVARQAIELLQRGYGLLGARQLYHNRSEITVALRRAVRNEE
jgi:23S rRNA (cytidine2498-2'-O)-methyltransferase